MGDGPFYRVRRDGYDICFLPDADEPLDEVTSLDLWVTFTDGERWSATVFTLDEARRLMDRWQNTGECLDGRYFFGWDDLIVRDPGIEAMTRVIDDLVGSGSYTSAMRPLGPEDDEDDEDENDEHEVAGDATDA
ncbi:hypothetical protein ACFY7A_06890 [Streptomyces longwoodensis]|uniref:hypothetical protein n=1 Tax=Streptomyces longwoodensis TaxID=68231 RepID=UPI003689DCA8